MRLFQHTGKPAAAGKRQTQAALPRSAVGIDISQYAVRMVLLSGHSLNQIRLEKYAVTPLPKNIVKGNKIQDYEQLVPYLQHTYTQLHTSCKIFVAAMPHGLASLEHAVSRTPLDAAGLEDFAESEVAQIGPHGDMNYDYQPDGSDSRSGGQKILIAAAKKDDVEPRAEMFEQAGLPLHALDLDLLAQRNAFAYWLNCHAPELAHEKIAVFGIYDTQMYALIMRGGQILYKQETAASVEQLLHLIRHTYQTGEEEARYMLNLTEKPGGYQSQIAERFNMQITQEVQRVLQFYYTTQTMEAFSGIKHILLTGSASCQPGLAESVSAQTNTPVQCVYPALAAERGPYIDAAQLQADAPALTVAFGLAARGL
ncbi:type IV pilus assembly protein PilM [Bergeriella denitrificans]|uniref:PilM n=1 Tax=Bergeriella denitrificans TaxID=494 RepID=A0A378UDP3_BERDE|nr:type IV pilus assembly protein PilM [Bergeriella denitrificans]STZ75524.1 PilM [Bergeriella denitrificans]